MGNERISSALAQRTGYESDEFSDVGDGEGPRRHEKSIKQTAKTAFLSGLIAQGIAVGVGTYRLAMYPLPLSAWASRGVMIGSAFVSVPLVASGLILFHFFNHSDTGKIKSKKTAVELLGADIVLNASLATLLRLNESLGFLGFSGLGLLGFYSALILYNYASPPWEMEM